MALMTLLYVILTALVILIIGLAAVYYLVRKSFHVLRRTAETQQIVRDALHFYADPQKVERVRGHIAQQALNVTRQK